MLLEKIQALKKPVFNLNDLVKLTGKKKNYLKVQLFRLKHEKLVKEAERNKYYLPPTHPYTVASFLTFPSYLSFLSAYEYYKLTTQLPKKITIVSLRSKKTLMIEGSIINFVRFSPTRFFGYKKEKMGETYLFIAEKEKAILDALYLPRYCPLDETFAALEEKLDIKKLVAYALRMESSVLLKRLGYLLERRGIDIYPRIKSKINKKYDFLDPLGERGKEKNKRWHLIINRRL